MRKFYALAASLVFSCYVPVAFAAEGSVAISSPQEGAKFSPKTDIELVYDISLGDKGDHTHLYIDDKEILTLRNLKGSHALGTLPARQTRYMHQGGEQGAYADRPAEMRQCQRRVHTDSV